MPDIFISYARDDRHKVAILAEALALHGWSVWWDRDIPFGKPFDHAIEEALTSAKCVLVVWSPNSIARSWVLEEASYAREKEILIPIFLHRVIPPLGFRRIQAADLSNWNGGQDDAEFRKLLLHITEFLRRVDFQPEEDEPLVSEANEQNSSEGSRVRNIKRTELSPWIGVVMFVVVLASIVIYVVTREQEGTGSTTDENHPSTINCYSPELTLLELETCRTMGAR